MVPTVVMGETPGTLAENIVDEDEWRNRKTKDTRREEREERERRVAAWVNSGGSDAQWMLSVEDRDDFGEDGGGEDIENRLLGNEGGGGSPGGRDPRRLSMDE